MRRLGTKLGLQLVLLLIALGVASTLHAQLLNTTYATLDVCNKGTVKVDVATAIEQDNFPSFTPLWNVTYWTKILPGACKRVYYDRTGNGNQATGLRAYIGFGFFDAQGHFVTGTVDRVPDFGDVGLLNSKILTKTNTRFCINDSDNGMTYRIEDPLERNCATFHPGGNGDKTKPLYPFAAALYFRPETSYCPVYPAIGDCAGGQYVLNVAPGPNDVDGNLHVLAGSSSDSSSEQGSKMAGDFLNALVKAGAEDRQRQEQAEVAAEEERLQHAREQQAAREAHQNQIKAAAAAGDPTSKSLAQIVDHNKEINGQRWAGPRRSPSSYDQQWMGQNIAIVGTVSRVEVAPSDSSPQWVTIYFKESPDATFVVCSPYPDLLQEKIGLNLSALVGKTLEAAGQVESPYCGHKVPKGSLRVLESKQWQVH